MRLLDKLVLKDLIPWFGMGVAMFTALYFAADPVLVASRYLSAGVPLPVVLHIIGLYLPRVLALTLPMGMLLAVLLGFGRLSGDSEAVAIFAGGIPFLRAAAPAAAMGLVASLVGYVVNDKVTSAANAQIAALQEQIGTIVHGAGQTDQPYHFEDRKDGKLQATVQVEHGIDPRGKDIAVRDVTVTQFNNGQPVVVFHADRGVWRGGSSWQLINVTAYYLAGEVPYKVAGKDGTTEELGLTALEKTPEEMQLLHRDPNTLDFATTRRQIALLRANGTKPADVRSAEMDLWSKLAFPFASLVFTVIGAPLGLRPQRSSKYTGYFLAILIIFGYYVLYTTLGNIARGGGVPPALAAFLPDLIGLALGGALVWRASRS
ncbi:MAG: LptF/LptG family permease [Armatimonadetes bacterium]|nr:LptF/LptG family permease [Armatimonadota bacterium]